MSRAGGGSDMKTALLAAHTQPYGMAQLHTGVSNTGDSSDGTGFAPLPMPPLVGPNSTAAAQPATVTGRSSTVDSRSVTNVDNDSWSFYLCGNRKQGHTGLVTCLQIFEEVLYTGSTDCTIRAWDTQRGSCRAIFRGHTDRVTALAYNRGRLYSCSADRTAIAWAMDSFAPFRVFHGSRAHTAEITALLVHESKDNEALASGRASASGSGGADYDALYRRVHLGDVAVSGAMLYTAGLDGLCIGWDITTGQVVARLAGHRDGILSMIAHSYQELLPDQHHHQHHNQPSTAASDPGTGSYHPRPGHSGAPAIPPKPTAVAVDALATARSEYGASPHRSRRGGGGGYDPLAAAAAEARGHFTHHHAASAAAPAVRRVDDYESTTSPFGVTGGSKLDPAAVSISVVAAKYAAHRVSVTGSGDAGGAAVGAVDGVRVWVSVLYTASQDGTVRSWNLANQQPMYVYRGHTRPVTGLQLYPTAHGTPHDATRLYTCSMDGTARVWRLDGGNAKTRCVGVFAGHTDAVVCLQVIDRGLLTGSVDHTIRLWNTTTLQCVRNFANHKGPVTCLFAPPPHHAHQQTELLYSGARDKTVRIWELESGERRYVLPCAEPVTTLRLNEHERVLYSACASGVQEWNTGVGNCRTEYRSPSLLESFLPWLLVLMDSLQMMSFAFSPQVLWTAEPVKKVEVLSFDLPFNSHAQYNLLFWCVAAFVTLFLAMHWSYTFLGLSCLRRHRTTRRLTWAVCFVATTVAQVPFSNVLILPFECNCNSFPTDCWHEEVAGLQCFQSATHLSTLVVAAVLVLPFLIFSFRMRGLGGDVDGVSGNHFWSWRKDHKIAMVFHLLMEDRTSTTFARSYAFLRNFFFWLRLFLGQEHEFVQLLYLIVVSLLVIYLAVRFPAFLLPKANALHVGLLSCVAWCAVCGFALVNWKDNLSARTAITYTFFAVFLGLWFVVYHAASRCCFAPRKPRETEGYHATGFDAA